MSTRPDGKGWPGDLASETPGVQWAGASQAGQRAGGQGGLVVELGAVLAATHTAAADALGWGPAGRS